MVRGFLMATGKDLDDHLHIACSGQAAEYSELWQSGRDEVESEEVEVEVEVVGAGAPSSLGTFSLRDGQVVSSAGSLSGTSLDDKLISEASSVLLVGVCLVCRRLHRPKPSTDCLDSSCVALMQIQI